MAGIVFEGMKMLFRQCKTSLRERKKPEERLNMLTYVLPRARAPRVVGATRWEGPEIRGRRRREAQEQ
jgi:hypothetical protein